MNTYYVVWIFNTALTNPQKNRVRSALQTFGLQDDTQPYRITHHRPRLDGQAVLLVLTVSADTTKADFVAALAAELGVSAATVNANTTFIKMAGSTTEERAQSARDYVIANAAEWEPNT